MRELRQGVIAREAEAEAQMYDAAAEEERVTTSTVVAVGRSSAWLLVDGDEMEAEDDKTKAEDDKTEAEDDKTEAEDDKTDVTIREAVAQRDAELAARGSEEHYEHHHVEDLTESRVKVEVALTAVVAERVAAAKAKRIAAVEAKRVTKVDAAEREAAERAAHWVAEMDKALAYWRDVDWRDASHRAHTEHRLER
jgi:hypothetical protein